MGVKDGQLRTLTGKKLFCFKCGAGGGAVRIPRTAGKANKWVLDQFKPELSLEVEMLRLSCFGPIMRRQDSLEKTVMLGKAEGSRKRGRPNMRWTDSPKEAPGLRLQEVRTGQLGDHPFIGCQK